MTRHVLQQGFSVPTANPSPGRSLPGPYCSATGRLRKATASAGPLPGNDQVTTESDNPGQLPSLLRQLVDPPLPGIGLPRERCHQVLVRLMTILPTTF